MRDLTVKDVEFVAFSLAQELLAFNEPIPDFSSRYPNRLESSLAAPFLSFGGKSLYPTLISKAAILFYLMIKNHPFQNGNKRIATTTLLVFLLRNNKWLEMDPENLYQFTVWIASSPPKEKDSVVKAVESFLQKYLVETH